MNNEELLELLKQCETAFVEISKKEGRFSVDRFQHACNTIEDMAQLALDALADLRAKVGDSVTT